MTDMTMTHISQLEDMSVSNISKLQEIQALRGERMTIESERLTEGFKNYSRQKIKYFTGLPSFSTFMALFNFIAPSVGDNSQSTLPLFQQFLMVTSIELG